MDEKETVSQDQAQLDHLEEEIKEARHHLDDETHQEEHEPYLFEDDQDEQPEAPGNDNVPAP
jgi:uncharacterized protein YjaZ